MVYLTQLFQDNFTRANENPLNPTNWQVPASTYNIYCLQIISDLCVVARNNDTGCEFCIGATAPNDQYAQVTLANLGFSDATSLDFGVRDVNDNGGGTFGTGYYLDVINLGSGWGASSSGRATLATRSSGGYTSLGSVSSLTLNPNDVWTLAAIGTTLYVLQNGTQVLSVTNATYASGQSGLGSALALTTNCQISNFAMGSASTTPPAPADVGTGPSILATMHGMRG
jgi:hypothetical protein